MGHFFRGLAWWLPHTNQQLGRQLRFLNSRPTPELWKQCSDNDRNMRETPDHEIELRIPYDKKGERHHVEPNVYEIEYVAPKQFSDLPRHRRPDTPCPYSDDWTQ